MDQATEYVTAKELARRLHVSPETVRDWARRGCIPSLRVSRKVVRFDVHAVLAKVSENAGKGVSNG